jgi:hypothetical protein
MLVDRVTRIFFILYCIEAGIFLLWAPWTGFWERALSGLPFPGILHALLAPVARGGVSGFGLVHLVWGLHDLESILTHRLPGGRG